MVICKYCKREFHVKPNVIKRGGGKYCSVKCYGLSQQKRIKRQCIVCKKEFTTSQGYINKGWAKWCSKKCQHLKQENNANWRGGKKEKECLQCNKIIYKWNSEVGNFCSRSCVSIFYGKGKNNPNWQGGISFEPYSSDWTESLKHSIKVRDNFSCQICLYKQNKISHNIHHINYNKKDNNPQNLITLCNKCHSKTNFKREIWQNKLLQLMKNREGT